MAAYMIVETVEVTDRALFDRYVRSVGERVVAFGGRYLVRGGNPATLDGGWKPSRLVLIEFRDRAALDNWWESDAYAELRALRERSSRCNIVAMDGEHLEMLDPVTGRLR